MKRPLSFHLVPILAGLPLMLCWPTEATAAAKSYKPSRDKDITSLTEYTLKVRNATAVRLADEVADSDITLVHNEQTYEREFGIRTRVIKQNL